MTTAPANLLAARRLLLDHLNIDKYLSRTADLEPAEVGIVGDPAHRGGYHCGADRVLSEDYSVVESARDRTGLSDFACALDVGDFSVSVAGKRHTLATFSMWLVAQCKSGSADTKDIREVIYSPDGVVVRRWDRLGRRTSGDSSHRWHTHISYHRDAVKAGRDQSAVFRRYLTYIGLIQAPTVEDEDMDATQAKQLGELHAIITGWRSGMPKTPDGKGIEPVNWRLRDEDWQARVSTALATLAGKDFTDEPAIVAGVLAGLSPEKIAAAIPQALTKQVADELARRMLAGEPANPTQ